jgi:hypothetical protein
VHTEGVSAELPELEGLRGRIEGWRQTRPKSWPMPEELWNEASAAAKRLGAGRVARALGLNYEALKQRVISSGPGPRRRGTRRQRQPEGAQFIELSGFPGLGQVSTRDEAVVEVVAADGTRLTIRVLGANVNVAALVNAFRGRS